MRLPLIFVFPLLLLCVSCATEAPSPGMIGNFQVGSDLFLPQFDSKTDVDDIHSVAAVATVLADPRFAGVNYHAVAGAYGIQEGLYVPANELFEAAFGDNWSDAHNDFDRALSEVTQLATNTLENGGSIWIAEAGQSDFSAALVKTVKSTLPVNSVKDRIHVVQHSNWNESVTSPEALAYVKENATYHKIPDGNAVGNGTPGFRVGNPVNWQRYITKPALVDMWEMAIEIANRYNGVEGRYLNADIASGGLDFSDTSETCWIFDFLEIENATQFFETFASAD